MMVHLDGLRCSERVVLIALWTGIAACDPREPAVETASDSAAGAAAEADAPGDEGVTVDEITDDATPFLGQTVTVTGEVARIGGPRMFTVEDSDLVGDEHLLVLSSRPVPELLAESKDPLADYDEVTVTGTVRRLVVTEVERELGFDLDPEYEVEFRDRPVLIATAVRRAGVAGEPSAAAPAPSVTDVLVLVPVPGPAELVGRTVQLENVLVQSVIGDQGFWVGPRHTQQVFVRLDERTASGDEADAAVNIEKGQRLTLFGTVERIPPPEEVQEKWDVDSAMARLIARNEALYVAADSVRMGSS